VARVYSETAVTFRVANSDVDSTVVASKPVIAGAHAISVLLRVVDTTGAVIRIGSITSIALLVAHADERGAILTAPSILTDTITAAGGVDFSVFGTLEAPTIARGETARAVAFRATWANPIFTCLAVPVFHTVACAWGVFVHLTVDDATLTVAAFWAGAAVAKWVTYAEVGLAVASSPE
jgi:hypothetical protein